MAKSKSKPQTEKSGLIRIPSRRVGGKKKPDLFAAFKKEHPLDDLLPEIFDNPQTVEDNNLDDQHKTLGRPTVNTLDDQHSILGRPETITVDDQAQTIDILGRPNAVNLDDKTTKKTTWTTKNTDNLDDLSSKVNNLDDQSRSYSSSWAKYENARATDRVGLRPNKETLRKFKVFCAQKGLTLTEFFELSGLKYLDLDDQTISNLDDLSPYDDRRMMISWKTKGHIINLYLRYNSILNAKSKWTVRDDEKGSQLNGIDIRVIELGIIQTQFQKNFKGKINSFGYYENEINNFADLGMSDEVLNTILKINRQRWQQATKKELDYGEFQKDADSE
jgi:hypothetical protein